MRYEYVDAHVPLGSSDQMRVRNVFLNNTLLIVLQIGYVINQGNFASSTEICGFTNPYLFLCVIVAFCSVFRKLLYECFRLSGKAVGSRDEVVTLSKHVLHSLY